MNNTIKSFLTERGEKCNWLLLAVSLLEDRKVGGTMEKQVTARDVAQWMLDEIEKHGELYKPTAVINILSIFGSEFARIDRHSQPAIHSDVLVALAELSGGTIRWNADSKSWTKRRLEDS